MKHTYSAPLLLSLCTLSTLQAMEKNHTTATPHTTQSQSNTSPRTTLEIINEKINNKYQCNNGLSQFAHNLLFSPSDGLDILYLTCTQDPDISENTIKSLYNNNPIFAKAIYILIKHMAGQDFLHIDTPDTLFLEYQANQQAPSSIKEFILEKTLSSIQYDYTMTFTDPDNIGFSDFDISDITHILIAASRKNTGLFIYNLKTGDLTKKIAYKNEIYSVRLNHTGTTAATLANNTKQSNALTEWDISSGTAKRTFPKVHKEIDDIQYFDQPLTSPGLLLVFKVDEYPENLQASVLPEATQSHEYYCLMRDKQPRKYYGTINTSTHDIQVTKKQCVGLYICQKIIQDTNTPLDRIQQLSSYTSLTPYEKALVDKQLSQKLLTNK